MPIATRSTSQVMPCPCTPSRPYADCCRPFHQGAAATSPEQLMRSRYSAFALGLADYLLATWHPSTRPALHLESNPNWCGLEILQANASAERGEVQFRAYFEVDGEPGVMEETSRFVRQNGRWFYVDGDLK